MEIFCILGCIWVASLCAFLIFLVRIPRFWRAVICLALEAGIVWAGYVLHVLRFIEKNLAFGRHAQAFFTTLQLQLGLGTVSEEYLELPGDAAGILLSLLAVAAIVAGPMCCWMKIRRYSYAVLPAAVLLTGFLFAFPDAVADRRDTAERNDFRREVYGLIAETLARGVTCRQMADAVAANLADFRYSYENRDEERASVARILAAIRGLKPSGR